MGFKDFELIGDQKVKCKTCGEEMPTGIIAISNHWVNCTGKEFTKAAMKKANVGYLTPNEIEELRKKYL